MKKSLKNKFEVKLNTQLVKSKVKFKYESRKIPYVLACHYTPDFVCDLPSGLLIIEGKGYFRQADRRKLAAVKRQHPELDIRIVFYRANPEYIRWAKLHGFNYAIGSIPEEWLK